MKIKKKEKKKKISKIRGHLNITNKASHFDVTSFRPRFHVRWIGQYSNIQEKR